MVSFNTAITDKLNALSETVLSGHYIFSNGAVNEDYLAKRFSAPQKYSHNIRYEFADSAEDLQKYYAIREVAYRDILQEKDFSGAEDDCDRNSYILLAKAGNNVIGGARLTVSTPRNPQKMALEADGVDLQEIVPNLDLSQVTYCEMSRLALLPDFRQGNVTEEMYKELAKQSQKLGVQIGFARSTALHVRMFKANLRNLGYNAIIRKDVKLAHNESNKHLNMQFFCVDFTENKEFEDLLAAPELAPEAVSAESGELELA